MYVGAVNHKALKLNVKMNIRDFLLVMSPQTKTWKAQFDCVILLAFPLAFTVWWYAVWRSSIQRDQPNGG